MKILFSKQHISSFSFSDARISPVRRSPSKNRTPNITTMARLQRPDMDQVLVGIKSRINKENNSAYELKGRGRRGQQLEISPTSSKAEIRDWLNQIGDISDVTRVS